MKTIIFLFISIAFCLGLKAQDYELRGVVRSADDNTSLPGGVVKIISTNQAVATDQAGNFKLKLSKGIHIITVSHVGYKTREVRVNVPFKERLIVELAYLSDSLNEVVINTGFQQVKGERLTGSVSHIGNDLINRSVTTNITDRLRDNVPGLSFNRVGAAANSSFPVSIRGQSTLFAVTQPLIILDNFPYDGDIANINPNDVESITVLKDASAASIWGSRSANGVIVINTKAGKLNKQISLDFTSNNTIIGSIDAFYQPKMNTSDYIETEKKLFAKGFYNSVESSVARSALTPVVELLIDVREGRLSISEAERHFEGFKQLDVRNDYNKYIYRNGIDFQQALAVNGGAENFWWNLSIGNDHNNASMVGNNYSRITLNQKAAVFFLDKKLELNTGIYYVKSNRSNNAPTLGISGVSNSWLYPYARLADDRGNYLNTVKELRSGFIADAEQKGFLPWNYSLLEELEMADNTSKHDESRLNTSLKYKINQNLSAQILYQYTKDNQSERNNQVGESYFTRNLINRFTSFNSDGSVVRPIPLGAILDIGRYSLVAHNFRSQIDFNKSWNNHTIVALAGTEIRDVNTQGSEQRLYGYNPENATHSIVDYFKYFTSSVNPSSTNNLIPNKDRLSELTDRYYSWYGNIAYSFLNRYRFTASGRVDQSNIFGVNTNQKAVPLWSAGIAYNFSDEPFYKLKWVPYLNFRLSYGYNGNVDKSLSAYTTASYYAAVNSPINQPYAQVQNPPNPELRWERVSTLNFGIDFRVARNIITGTVDFYRRNGKDLIGSAPYAPSTGITIFKGNLASTQTTGMDLQIKSINVDAKLRWESTGIVSLVKENVKSYELTSSARSYLDFTGIPLQGKPLYSLFAYKWNGLDPLTGDPLGYIDGVKSKDYSKIINTATPETLEYMGPARPVIFGTVGNTFYYRRMSMSFNIVYKLGYYFRKSSVFYNNNYGLDTHGDFANRWQKQGDELTTFVPSVPATTNSSRDLFYTFSDVLVQKADHIRMQDLKLSYTLPAAANRTFKKCSIYLFANNIGLLWKANTFGIDPDYQIQQLQKSLSLGLKLGL